MAFTPYAYGGYPTAGGYYAPPMPDQLAQLRGAGQYQPQMMGQNVAQPMQTPPVQNPAPMAAQTPQAMAPAPQTQVQPSTMSGPVFVNGDAGARGFMVGAGNTVMLIDADPDAHTFWLKSADASGMPSMRTFDYTERLSTTRPAQDTPQTALPSPVDYVPRADFDALVSQISALESEIETLKAKQKANTVKKAVKDGEDNG